MSERVQGLDGVVVAETRLSMVDGEAGELVIAGFPLEDLAPNATFEEVLYLLWSDRLPTANELLSLREQLAMRRPITPASMNILEESARRKVPPMDALRMAVDAIGTCDDPPHRAPDLPDVGCAVALIAPFPTIVATYWRLLHGQTPVAPDPGLSHAANFLYMLEGKQPHANRVRALDTYLNTVIDHGMNASTFTARVIASTRSDMLSAVVGAIGALKGPLHGGAPGPALDMVFVIRKQAKASGKPITQEADAWVRQTMSSGDRVMGFGHRVYKVRDPRADVLAEAAKKLFAGAGETQLYDDARAVEATVLQVLEELKPGRNLKTNVEFYTALILHGLGLEVPVFTPTFAMSRVGGWTAHVLEQVQEGRLIRPQSAYRGPVDRQWVPIDRRS